MNDLVINDVQLCRTNVFTMEKCKIKPAYIIDTEMFGNGREQYFFDIKLAKNQQHYLRITNRRQETDCTYRRTQIVLFEEDLALFVEAITMLLGRLSSGNIGESC